MTLQDKKDIAKELLDIFHLRIPWAHGNHNAFWDNGQSDKLFNKKFPFDVNIREIMYISEKDGTPKACWCMHFTIETSAHIMEIDICDYERLFTLNKNSYEMNDEGLNEIINDFITELEEGE